MTKIVNLLLVLLFSLSSVVWAEKIKLVTDRETLCSLEFGRFENNAYVGSTPMEDACRIKHRESRVRICEHNYKEREIIKACIATYDAISFRIQELGKSK